MDDGHRDFFTKLYRFCEQYEHPPEYSEDPSFLAWWQQVTDEAAQLWETYKAHPLAEEMIMAALAGIERTYKAYPTTPK